MLTWIREKFGKVGIGAIVALLAAVFAFYGVFTPKATRGVHEGAVAGTVNGESISLEEFDRSYNRQLEFFKNMLGGAKLNEDQLKNFHIRESVFQELVRRKVMIQEAAKEGYLPSDLEVQDHILEIPAFQNAGKFDLDRYKQVLGANGYTPTSFEQSLKNDLAAEKWQDYFRSRVNVSEGEIQQQYLATGDKRNIRYVLVTTEAGKKDIKVDPAEVQKYLLDPAKVNLIKNQFEAKKNKEYKGKSFDQAKADIARDIILSTRMDEVKKANEQIADRVLAVMTVDKTSDAKVNQLLKPYAIEVKSTGLISRDTPYLPGIGEAKELMADAFSDKSPIDPATGGKVKRYSSMNWVLLAVVSESQKPDLAKLGTEHDKLAHEIIARKERSLFESWLKAAVEKAKVDPNPAVLGGEES